MRTRTAVRRVLSFKERKLRLAESLTPRPREGKQSAARTEYEPRRWAMTDALAIIEQAPLQDRDLLQRLSLYFDGFHHRLQQGQGWFIFNAPGSRASRITTFI